MLGAHDIFTGHKLTRFIEKEAAIKVTVECHAKVGLLSLDHISRRRMVFGKSGLGMPFGNVASGV